MKIIKKKCWPEFFEKILEGKKKFDVRLADFDIKEGDVLVLEEWNPETKSYTGRVIEKKAGYVIKINNEQFWSKDEIAKYGFQIISLD